MPGGRPITLFSGYDQKENRVTNYAILLLRMLYQESPAYLAEALADLTGRDLDEIEGTVGVQFRQQDRREASVPDAVVFQRPFTLFVETKNTDWFTDDQLGRHLAALADSGDGLKVLVALSRFDNLAENRFEHIQTLCETEYDGDVAFAPVSFEQFAEAVRRPGLPKRLAVSIDEFESFLDEAGLLPRWPRQLDVCNCGQAFHEQAEHGVYLCPATGGAYSHQRSRYFGAYKDKAVRLVGEIEAVVDLDVGEAGASVYYANVSTPEAELVARAREKRAATRPDADYPMRVFLLGNLHETAFEKRTPGGMMGSKQYFDVGGLDPEGPFDLAQKLRGLAWSDLQH